MGRRAHLEQTFGKNLEAGLKSNVDFEMVVLDYSSKDDLVGWFSRTYGSLVGNVIRYGRLEGKTHYNSPHAKNISHLLATGDVLCNMDADSFFPCEFMTWLHGIFLSPERAHARGKIGGGRGGRLALKREDFIKLGGYDEMMGDGWGADDSDLSRRAEAFGIKKIVVPDGHALQIPHTNAVRTENMIVKDHGSTNLAHDAITNKNIKVKKFIANKGKKWGEARLIVNFREMKMFGVQG